MAKSQDDRITVITADRDNVLAANKTLSDACKRQERVIESLQIEIANLDRMLKMANKRLVELGYGIVTGLDLPSAES